MNCYISFIVPFVLNLLLFPLQLCYKEVNCDEIQINYPKYKYLKSHKFIN